MLIFEKFYILTLIFLVPTINNLFYATAGNTEIKIAGLYSGENGEWEGEELRYFCEIAADMVKTQTTILQDYQVNITWRKSQCNRKISLNEYLNYMQEKENIYHFILGPSCSAAAEPVGEIIPSFSLNMITTSATSSGLTNANIYPNTYLGMPTYKNQVVIYLKLVQVFKWRRIGLIYQDTDLFNTLVEGVSEEFKRLNIQFDLERITYPVDNKEVDRKLDRLIMQQKHRIIIANFYEGTGFQVLCRAFKKNYRSPRVTWIIPSWFSSRWLVGGNGNCTGEEVTEFIEGSLGVDNNVRILDNNITSTEIHEIFKPKENTVFNITREELWEKILRRLSSSLYNVQNLDRNVAKYAIYAFDTTVTLLEVFDRALKDNRSLLEGFDYHDRYRKMENDKVAMELANHIENVEFSGLTGDVAYSGRARKLSSAEIVEFRNGQEVLIGTLKRINEQHINNFSSYAEEIFVLEPFEDCENDGIRCDGVELHHLPIPAFAFSITLAACTFIFTLIFVLINFCCRKKKVFKLSSPLLNMFILSGAILQCIVAVLVVIDNRFLKRTPEDNNSDCIGCTILCHLVWWLPALATDLIFGTLIGKAIRVYMIAIRQSFTFQVKVIYIISFIGAIMLFDTGYTVIWALIEAIRFQFIAEGPLETANTDITKPGNPFWYIFYCAEGGSPNSPAIGVRFFYILLRWILYGVGLYFAYQIRKVNIRGINEFQSITLATLITIFFNLVRIILITMIPSVRLIDAAISLLSISYALDTCLIVSFLFLPKLYYLIKDPNEKKVYHGVHNTSEVNMDSVNQLMTTKVKSELVNLKNQRDSLMEEVREIKERKTSLSTEFVAGEPLPKVFEENTEDTIEMNLSPGIMDNKFLFKN